MFNASTLDEIGVAFDAIAERQPDALLIGTDPFFLKISAPRLSRGQLVSAF